MFDTVVSAIVEGVAYALKRVLGTTFKLEKDKAKRLAENMLIAMFAALFLILAFSGVGT